MTPYTVELENLIVDILLPVYEKYCKEHGIPIDYNLFNKTLLNKFKQKKVLPALLMPKKI